MFRTFLLNLLLVPAAFAGLSLSNAVLTGSATLNGTNIADQAFVSNSVSASVAGLTTEEYVLAAVLAGTGGVAYASDVHTNILAVSNSIRVAVSSEIEGMSAAYEAVMTNVYFPSLAGLYYTQALDRISESSGAVSNYSVSVSNNLQPQIDSVRLLATSNVVLLINDAVASNYNAYAEFMTNGFVSSLIGLSNALVIAYAESLSGGASNYAVNASNNLAAAEGAARAAGLAYTTAVSNYLWTALSNYTYAVSNNLGDLAASDRAAASAYTYAVSNTVHGYLVTASNALSYLLNSSVSNMNTVASNAAAIVSVTNAAVVSKLSVPSNSDTNLWSFDAVASSVPSSRVTVINLSTTGVYRIITSEFTNISTGVGLGNTVTNADTDPWYAEFIYPTRVIEGGEGSLIAQDALDPVVFSVLGVNSFTPNEMVVKLFDTAVWSPVWDPLGAAPLATGVVTTAMVTNKIITLYSATNGYWGTITLSAYLFPGTTNVSATCPVKDPFPDIILGSNRVTGVASGLTSVSNSVTTLSSAFVNTSNGVTTLSSAFVNTSNRVSNAVYTNAIRIVTWDSPSVVAYITVSNNAIVVLPAPPPAP